MVVSLLPPVAIWYPPARPDYSGVGAIATCLALRHSLVLAGGRTFGSLATLGPLAVIASLPVAGAIWMVKCVLYFT